MFWRRKNTKPRHDDGTGHGSDAHDPGEDVAIAHAALANADLDHGAWHLGSALMVDPTRAEWLALLDTYIARAGRNPLTLAPLKQDEPNFEGVAAVRAYICAATGRMEEALRLLAAILVANPKSAFSAWLFSWRARPGFAAAFSPAVMSIGGQLLQRIPGDRTEEPEALAVLGRLTPVFALATEVCPGEPQTWFMYAAALRKAGRYDEARAAAQAGRDRAPGWPTAIAVALAARAGGCRGRAGVV